MLNHQKTYFQLLTPYICTTNRQNNNKNTITINRNMIVVKSVRKDNHQFLIFASSSIKSYNQSSPKCYFVCIQQPRNYNLQVSDIYNYTQRPIFSYLHIIVIKIQKKMRQTSRDKGREGKKRIFELQNQIGKLKQDCQQYRHKYTDLLKKHNVTLCNISREHSVKKQRDQSIKQERKIINFEFQWNRKTPNARKFKVKGKKVQRISMDKEGAAMISLIPLPKQGKNRVTFRINKNHGQYAISFGIITSKWRNQLILKNTTESVFYYSQQCGFGSLTIDGATIIPYQYNGLGTSEGGEIEMIVDLEEWEIIFTRKESYHQKKAKTIIHSLTDSFLDKDLHVFVRMYSYQDEVEIV